MNFLKVLEEGIFAAAGMFWIILWALILGFFLSGMIMAFVPKSRMVRLLGKSGPKELGLAMFFGAVSSSCSYAAASMARNLFQKGAHIIAALAFMLASTNLVIELSTILWILMGWQFVLAEFVGGIFLVFVMAGLMRAFAPLRDFEAKRAELGRAVVMHSGAQEEEISSWRSLEGWREVARSFVMEWGMIWKDIVLGVVIAGFLMVLVPDSFWQSLFLSGASETPGFLQVVENAAVGPLVSVVSFVCSVGNIPLASVLYHGGISFGGTISFIYADLIIIPLILVYRKYYGGKLALWIAGIFYASMVITGIVVDLVFRALGLLPHRHEMQTMAHTGFFQLNYTFYLNVAFIALALVLAWLARSGTTPDQHESHCCHH